jgi:hypothetical protein
VEQNELLRYTIKALEELGIAYMIGGSLASSAYGEPRLTNDIDIVADLKLEHVSGILSKFMPGEFYVDEVAVREALAGEGQFNIIHPSSGYKVDIFVCGQDKFGRSQIARRRRLEAPDGEHAFFASPEDVILKKMQYFQIGQSERQIRDIAGMLRVQGDQLDRDYIRRWASEMGLTEVWEAILRRISE